jgi:hypothetical protein
MINNRHKHKYNWKTDSAIISQKILDIFTICGIFIRIIDNLNCGVKEKSLATFIRSLLKMRISGSRPARRNQFDCTEGVSEDGAIVLVMTLFFGS